MGLFSSKKKTTVGTAVARVIDDDGIPNALQTGMAKSIFRDEDLYGHVMNELANSAGLRTERLFKRAKDHYPYGLPVGKVVSPSQGSALVQAVLDGLEGAPVTLEYSRYGPPNNYHIAWTKLIAEHGYNPLTNRLSVLEVQTGRPTYLDFFQLVISPADYAAMDASAKEQWGVASNSGYAPQRRMSYDDMGQLRINPDVIYNAQVTEPYVLVQYVADNTTYGTGNLYPDEAGRYTTGTFTIDVNELDDGDDYFHAKYKIGGVIKYWMYRKGAGTYPTLDGIDNAPNGVPRSYFPFLYFRFDKVSAASTEGTNEYAETEKLLKYLRMDYAEMIDTIHENPDIGDVEQAMMVFAVSPTSSHPVDCRYLFDYFNGQYALQGADTISVAASIVNRLLKKDQSLEQYATVIQDNRFKMTLSNQGVYKRFVQGSIGKVGLHTSAFVAGTSSHFFRKQVSASTYEEIEVRGLRMTYHIWNQYTTTGDDNDDILLIPLDHAITETYSIPDREAMYLRSLHFVFNSRVTIKVKWYQTGVFKAILTIAAIALTIYTYGATWQSMAAALAAGTITFTAVMFAFAMELLTAMVYAVIIKEVVSAIGGELALIIAVVVALYAGYKAFEAGSLAGSPWATELLQLSNSLASGVGDFLEDEFSDLAIQAEEFGLYVEEKSELLDQANDLLKGNVAMSPIVVFGENPNDFYNRTVHAGNIGTLGISAIQHYVDVALRLPELSDSLGE